MSPSKHKLQKFPATGDVMPRVSTNSSCDSKNCSPFKMLIIIYRLTHHVISEHLNLQQCHCENVRYCRSSTLYCIKLTASQNICCICITKTSWLLLFCIVMAVHAENRTKCMNTKFEPNVELCDTCICMYVHSVNPQLSK